MPNKKANEILIEFNKVNYKCQLELDRPDISPVTPNNIGFQCTIPIESNIIVDFNKIHVTANFSNINYPLDRCCNSHLLNRIIFMELVANPYWQEYVLNINNIDLYNNYLYLFQNIKYNKFDASESLTPIASKFPTYYIQSKGSIRISMPDSILLTIYFIWNYLASLIILIYAYFVKT